jgi:hypothetical protein
MAIESPVFSSGVMLSTSTRNTQQAACASGGAGKFF